MTRTYFYSGNTQIVDGSNKQQCGTFIVSDDSVTADDVVEQLLRERTEELGAQFILVAFNRVE